MSDSTKPPWERFADVFAPKDSSLWLEISTSVRLACKEHAEAESFVRDAALAQRDKALDRLAQPTTENQKLRAALVALHEAAADPGWALWNNPSPIPAAVVQAKEALATTSAPAVVPREDAEALASALAILASAPESDFVTPIACEDWRRLGRETLAAYRSRHPLP